MTKVGLDTNILVRYITDDDQSQADKVQEYLTSHKTNTSFIINNVVLAELDWVLTSVYGYSKEEFLFVIDHLFQTNHVSFQSPDLVSKACSIYMDGRADFSDCLIGALNREQNCKTTYTFDKKASKLPSFTLLG